MIAAVHRRTALIGLVTAGIVVLAVAPAAVAFGLGWVTLQGGKHATSLDAWALFAIFYLFWMAGLMVLLVWTFDHIGYRWHAPERSVRPGTKERRRTRATMRAVDAEQRAALDVMRRREEREARRRRDRERDEAWRRGPDDRGPGGGR